MEFVGNYVGGMASNWIASTVEGAKGAAIAYGGNLAGDVIAAGGGLIEGAGRQIGGGELLLLLFLFDLAFSTSTDEP